MSIRCCDRPSGFTLVETLISATLVLLVFSLGGHFLIPLMKMQVKGSERAELQQRCAIAIEELRRDLATTTAGGISLVQSDTEILLGIHPSDDVAQDGTLVWKDHLILYRWRQMDGIWRRSIWEDPARDQLRGSAPTRLSEPALRHADRESKPLRLTPGVESALLATPGLQISFPLTATLRLASPSGEKRELTRTLGGRLPTV